MKILLKSLMIKPIALTALLFFGGGYLFAQPYYGVKQASSGWSIGLATGLMQVVGDISPDGPGYAGNLIIQRTLSRVMDSRFDIGGGVAYGISTIPFYGYANNSAWNGEYYPTFAYPDGGFIYPNFKMEELHASMMLKWNINRLISKTATDAWDVYLMGGFGAFFYNSRVNLYNATSRSIYDYSQITPGDAAEVRAALHRLMDDSYDVYAENDGATKPVLRPLGMILNPAIPVGGGFYHRVSSTFGIGIEVQITFMEDDLLDGQRWRGDNQPSATKDKVGRAMILMGYHF